MLCVIDNVDIRRTERKVSRHDGRPFMIVDFEDRLGDRCELVERDPARFDIYRRGMRGSFLVDVTQGSTKAGSWYTNIEIRDFQEVRA